MKAFWEMSADRSISGTGSVGPIPSRTIQDYCAEHHPGDYDTFVSVMRAMDREFLSNIRGDSPGTFSRDKFKTG